MLISLRIENFAIVSTLELDFIKGLTAFTGETGAGKSIMIDALMLALGERADASVIRKGAEKCDISACFHIDDSSQPAYWLKEQDIDASGGEVILRRVIYAEGRSKSYINGQPLPLQKVKELSEMLVDIHGQHQHQTLLHHATHRQQLDRYANHHPLLDAVYQHYQQCQRIKVEIEALQNHQSSAAQATLLQAQIDELVQLDPQPDEMHALHDEHQLLHHARDYLEKTQYMIDILSADDAPTVCRGLNQILQTLNAFPQEHPAIKTSQDLINGALIQCEEALDEMRRFVTQVQLDPERLKQVEDRISNLHHAARKYHVEANKLPLHITSLQQQVQDIENYEQKLTKLQQRYLHEKQCYDDANKALNHSRQQHAEKLALEITACIQQLGMPKGFITMAISPLEKMQPHGSDKVEYLVCTNPGSEPDSLAKVASGGELSRIGLAIHMITAQRATTPTLLFDEVDVGIGGATAALVGQLLRQLGDRLQVFCVTHQPQVAACAHNHFLVEKQSDNAQTYSHITALTQTEKINEIARMLGGITITEQTRSHAKELLTQGLTC